MKQILPFLMSQGKLLFALTFLTPLFAQIIERSAYAPPFGLSPLLVGGILAGALGVGAKVRGKWL
jgi:hypothetical protein